MTRRAASSAYAGRSAYIALGSNLDNPRAQVLRAVSALQGLPRSRFVGRSSLYASRPLGGMRQPDYVNAVAALETRLSAEEVLEELQGIEQAMGRPAEHERWGPRVIDLDLLLLGTLTCATSRLTLPHPGIVQRSFVLYPLAELAPELVLPGLGRVTELRDHLGPEGLERLPD
jgi:2-amino-4-hydroxy-6-hydroxymethyldihydropteridine diphosphokinase